jgi:hypothetical protein
MPSPFPGMNPFLEQAAVWHDFHERAIPLMADMLELQSVVHRVYDAARYVNWIYASEPEPTLPPDADAWAKQFVPSKARKGD